MLLTNVELVAFFVRRRKRVKKEELNKYIVLKKRVKKLQSDIVELECGDVIADKVKGSDKEHPYIIRNFTIQTKAPEVAERNKKYIVKKNQEVEELKSRIRCIEKFIDGIEDIHIKNIFEYRFLEGMTCKEVGRELGYSHGRISQIVANYLEAKERIQ